MSIIQLHFPSSNRSSVEVSAQEQILVGRAPSCNLRLAEYDTVSRKHLKIFYQNGHFVVNDLNSTNGTWLNGYRLEGGQVRILRDGDMIQIANEPHLLTLVRIMQPHDCEDTKPIPTDPMWLLLLEELQQYRDVMLLGIAGVGKTTLLQKLMPQSKTQHLFDKFWPAHRSFLFFRLDGMAISDTNLSSFFQMLIATTKPAFEEWPDEIKTCYEWLESGACSIQDIRTILVTTIEVIKRSLGKRIVFLLDHFDDIYPKFPSELFWLLKELKSVEPRVLYVIAMRNEFDGTNPYIHQFLRAIHPPNYHWLPPMRPEKLKGVIRPYRLPPEKVQISIELGGRQPRLTELVANALQDMATMSSNSPHLIRLLLADNLINDHCREIWESLSSEEQKALWSVANGEARMSYRIERQLTDNKSLLIGEGEALRLENPLFAAYVRARQAAAEPQSPAQAEAQPEAQPQPQRHYNIAKEPTVKVASGEEIKTDGQPILRAHLTELEEKLLTYMYERAGQVCTHDEILTHIWGYNANDPASQASISNLVRNLRKKLDQLSPGAGKRHIRNVRGRGYIYVKNE